MKKIEKRPNPCRGSTLDEFLNEAGIYEEVEEMYLKRMIALELKAKMKKKKLTQQEVAKRMNTSRAVLQRLLDTNNKSTVTLDTLQRAATAVGSHISIKFK